MIYEKSENFLTGYQELTIDFMIEETDLMLLTFYIFFFIN